MVDIALGLHDLTLGLHDLTLAIVVLWAYSLQYDHRVDMWDHLQRNLADALVSTFTARRAKGDGAIINRYKLEVVARKYICTQRDLLEKRLAFEGTTRGTKEVYSRISDRDEPDYES
jgi:hypothetical protein